MERGTNYSNKRDLVLSRKNYLTHKISDIMSFVNNSKGLWDFIELERDWENIGTNYLSSRDLEETTDADAIGQALIPMD